MRPAAKRSVGTIIKANSTPVGGLTSISGIEESTETIDVTTLDSEGGSREFIAGFSSPGEVSLEGFLLAGSSGLESGQLVMKNLKDSGAGGNFEIVFPNNLGLWRFKGIVTSFGTSFALEDAISFSATITVSGKPQLIFGGGGAGGFSSSSANADEMLATSSAVEAEKKGRGDK